MASHYEKAKLLRDEFESATGVRPAYPRSRRALIELQGTLDRYRAALQDVRNLNAGKQGERDFTDEAARLGQIDTVDDDFDLDTPTSAGQLEGKAGWIFRQAKVKHQREGAVYVFSSWRLDSLDPHDIGDADVSANIRVRGGNIIRDYTLTPERASELLKKIPGEYIVKVKFLREQEPDKWVVEDGFAPLRQDKKRGGEVFEVSPRTRPGALVGIDQLYYKNAYPVSAVVFGLYQIRDPKVANLEPMRDGWTEISTV